MRRCDFIKIVKYHYPTWTTKQYGGSYVQFNDDNGLPQGGVTSWCAQTGIPKKDKEGLHLAVAITFGSKPELIAVGLLHGLEIYAH